MTDTVYEKRYAAALAELQRAGIWRWNGEPPYLRLLRRTGMQLRPPHYLSFFATLFLNWSYFTVSLGAILYLFKWAVKEEVVVTDLAGAVPAGMIFGSSMAVVHAFMRLHHKLSRWEDLA